MQKELYRRSEEVDDSNTEDRAETKVQLNGSICCNMSKYFASLILQLQIILQGLCEYLIPRLMLPRNIS